MYLIWAIYKQQDNSKQEVTILAQGKEMSLVIPIGKAANKQCIYVENSRLSYKMED